MVGEVKMSIFSINSTGRSLEVDFLRTFTLAIDMLVKFWIIHWPYHTSHGSHKWKKLWVIFENISLRSYTAQMIHWIQRAHHQTRKDLTDWQQILSWQNYVCALQPLGVMWMMKILPLRFVCQWWYQSRTTLSSWQSVVSLSPN